MYHHVPDFEMDEDYSIHSSSGVLRPRKTSLPDDEIMELLWQNGQVVMQSQNQRSTRRSPQSKYHDAVIPGEESAASEIRSGQEPAAHNQHNHNPHLFMQEDEMASWLHYPLVDDDPSLDSTFCADLLYPTNNLGNTSSCDTPVHTGGVPELRQAVTAGLGASRPPIPPASRTELAESKAPNFVHFSRHKPKVTGGGPDKTAPSSSRSAVVVRESTVVDSSETPSVGPTSNFGDRGFAAKSSGAAAGTSSGGDRGGGGGEGVTSAKETATCELTVTSSPGCSSTSAEAAQKPPAEDRKRKGREADDAECQSEDVECEFTDAKRQVRGSTTTRRSRAAEVHNLSERRRRDRINEKMKALQELIPRCNKSDKASMLDEAIEYLKSLQLQVQMMSMGCGMVPMMFPGVQHYMPAMGMGIGMGMGMGMGMEMGINRPMMPFPNVLAGSSLPTPAAVAQLGPRFPLPAFHMLPVPAPDPSRIQAANQSEQMLNSLGSQVPSQAQFPNFADPYQHYVATHQMQLPIPQNEALTQPSSSKPSTNKGPENLDNRQ